MRRPSRAPARVVPRTGARLLRLAYAAVITVATLRGLAPDGDLQLAWDRLWRALHPAPRPSDVIDAVRNVALFAGFGAVWLATSAATRLRRALVRATVIGALLSAAVEAAQLFSQRRMASVLDVGTNTAGAFAGALVVALGVAAARARRPVPLAPAPMAVVALPYVAACLLEAFSAFGRPDAVPGASGGPGARWAAAFAQLRTHPGALPGAQAAAWTDALLFAPAGAFVVLLWAERGGRPRAGAVAAAAALALAWAFAELLRGVSGGDMAPAAVAVRTLASAATAAAVAAALGGAGPARVRALVARGGAAAYAALLLAWSWQPFAPVGSLAEVVERLGGRAWVPLAALADAYTLHSVADVGVGSLLYVPVGAWLAVRGGGRLRTLWPGIALAAAAEGGQAAVAARTFDVTDLLVQAAGVFLGWAVVRQADVLRAAGRPAVRSARDDDGAADPSADRPAAPPAATSPAPA